MPIRWLTAFIDLPVATFDVGTQFWRTVTRSAISPTRGDHDEFVTLVAPVGDPYLRMQRLAEGPGGVHLDLHVDSIPDAIRHAERCGAVIERVAGHAVMSSPAGFRFCLVSHDGESVVTDPVDHPRPHIVDQVSIDVPATRFAEETAFWEQMTGWERRAGSLPEFAYLIRPAAMPLRLLFQRLGGDDPAVRGRAHLDLAGGDHREEIAAEHVRFGADRVDSFPRWIAMRDPAGLPYCVTGRDPVGVAPGSVG